MKHSAHPFDSPRRDWWSDLVEAEFAETARVHLSGLVSSEAHVLDDHSGPETALTDNDNVSVGDDDVGDVAADGNGGIDLEDVHPNPMQLQLEAAVCIPFQTPLVSRRPRLRRARSPISVHSLRRSGRIAARPRAGNATARAQRVLLKKLGVAVVEEEANVEVEKKFKLAFGGNMSQRKQHALQLFLNEGIDLTAMNLDLEGLEEGA